MEENLALLATEQNNPNSKDIDLKSTREMIEIFYREDRSVPDAIHREKDSIEIAIEGIVGRLRDGGRLIYIGAGTSGRLGILDASECVPTFGTDPGMVIGLIAGGNKALRESIEGAEDDVDAGKQSIAEQNVTDRDAVVGIAASGRTPYVVGALKEAKGRGAYTVGISNTKGSVIGGVANVAIEVVTGPEVIMGSTRLKAGTAQKLVLNMISTISMIRLGKVYQNLMVDLVASNEKLEQRAITIVARATGKNEKEAQMVLEETGGDVKAAILRSLTGVSAEEAKQLIKKKNGVLRDAIETEMA